MKQVERIQKALIEKLKTEILVDYPDFNYIEGWIQEKNYQERIKNKDDNFEKNVPFVLTRPLKLKQSHKNGISERKQEFLIMVVIKDKENSGYYKILDILEKIVNFFHIENVTKDYFFDLDFESKVSEDLSEKDYWVGEIKMIADLEA